MKVLLTGITGNLGFEIAHSLNERMVEVVPVVRNVSLLTSLCLSTDNVIVGDLIENEIKVTSSDIDCIVHSAGNVHFEKAGDTNSNMMLSVITIAKDLGVPIYYVSTAFLWRSHGNKDRLRNAYEKDKYHSEELLRNSGVPHTIFRPSVLVGHSQTGLLRNWSGYYLLAGKFLEAASLAGTKKIRFPVLTGTSNMVPVDQAAEAIVGRVLKQQLGKLIYVTNPEPPPAQWVLDTTLEIFGVANRFEWISIDYRDYKNVKKTKEEEALSTLGQYFSPYWSLSYNFPKSACTMNLITKAYLQKTLDSFQGSDNFSVV